jgi:hypothetical protein
MFRHIYFAKFQSLVSNVLIFWSGESECREVLKIQKKEYFCGFADGGSGPRYPQWTQYSKNDAGHKEDRTELGYSLNDAEQNEVRAGLGVAPVVRLV